MTEPSPTLRSRAAAERDLPDWLALRALLWPDGGEDHAGEVSRYFTDGLIGGVSSPSP